MKNITRDIAALVDSLRAQARNDTRVAVDGTHDAESMPAWKMADTLDAILAHYERRDQRLPEGTRIYTHPAERVAVPEGYVLVPREPTPEMLKACDTIIQGYGAKLVYARMIEAAEKGGV